MFDPPYEWLLDDMRMFLHDCIVLVQLHEEVTQEGLIQGFKMAHLFFSRADLHVRDSDHCFQM